MSALDLNALLDQVDLNAVLDQLDIDRLLERMDLNEIITRIDVAALVEQTDLGAIIAASSSGAAGEVLDPVAARPSGLKFEAEPAEPGDQRSGSLAIFCSRIILPAPSTTQTLKYSNDTSIPA